MFPATASNWWSRTVAHRRPLEQTAHRLKCVRMHGAGDILFVHLRIIVYIIVIDERTYTLLALAH